MAKRTQFYQKIPWTGGVNDSVDPGVLNDNDLVKADNVIFATSGSRLKRQGLSYIDEGLTDSVLMLQDYWRTDASNVQQQLLIACTEKVDLYSYNASNTRTEILGQEETTQITCAAQADISDDEYVTLYTANDAEQYDFYYNKGSATGAGLTNATEIDISSGVTTAADVASATAATINTIDGFSASFASAVVTVVNDAAGKTTDATENVSNSGFTVAVTAQGASKPTSDVEIIRSVVFNNRLILCFNDVGVEPIKYRPEDSAKYQKLLNAPDASFMEIYLSRLWCNDKTDPHRLHYSTTGEFEEWNGVGDSGALDIDPGDGDPVGITNVFTYKGGLFVQKKNKFYRVLGDSPENFQVVPISQGIGSEGSMAIKVDQDDVVFVSKRGFHSAQATDQFGDVSSQFLSAKIQNTFNEWPQSRLKNIQGAWLPELNSIAFGVTSAGAVNNEIWLYNIELQAWYKWPNIGCEALSTRLVGNNTKPVFGTSDGKIIQAQNGDYVDFITDSYPYKVKTGRIYPGGNPSSMKAFKKIGFIYRPIGDFNFSVRVKIDNGATQALTFSQESTTEALGVDFILGQSVLGFDSVLSPYFSLLDGYGRGLTLEIEQNSLEQQVEIYGFIIEYEEEGFRQEVATD